MYEDLVKALMHCYEKRGTGCGRDCEYGKDHPFAYICLDHLMLDAVKAIVGLRDTVQSQASLLGKYGGETGIRQSHEFVEKYFKLLEKRPRWKPVHEILPNEYGEYLVLWRPKKNGVVPDWKYYYEIAEYEPGDGWISEIPQSAPMGGYEVCYWMDLPPEPRKEQQC